jgi:uncharacterized protein
MTEQRLKFYRAYEVQAAAWDAEFARVSARFADRMQCRKGCSQCCSQMFSISSIEAGAVARAVAELPPAERERIREAAWHYLAEARRQGLTTSQDGDEDTVAPRTGARLVCPALRNDACAIYAARPLICRKWGIPIFDPSKPDRLHACELNFRSGESLDAADLVAPQRALLEEWARIKDDFRDSLHLPASKTTVAEAIVGRSELYSPHPGGGSTLPCV